MNIDKIAKSLKKAIEKFDTIAVFRHQMPDFDALGTQWGLVTFIKENYPKKKVYSLGEPHKKFTGLLYPENDVVSDDELFSKPFLSIVVDTANSARISDDRYARGAYMVKIDHHPAVEDYANENYVMHTCAAASEYVGRILFSKVFRKQKVSKNAAKYLYSGIVGDCGRFQYPSTSKDTFDIASKLVNTGFDLQLDVYQPMYMKKVEDLRISAYVLSNFKMSEHGVAYYYMDQETQDKFNITVERGKENINLLSNIEEIKIWVSFTIDSAENLWRVSIRSRHGVTVNGVAAKYNGGGHANACGAKAKDIEETLALIKDLDDLLI